MFTADELRVIAAMAESEGMLLGYIERRGIPTAQQQAAVFGLRAKAVSLMEQLAKVESEKLLKEKK